MFLRNWARSFFSPPTNRKTRRSRAKSSAGTYRPRCESLEDRLNMAGGVVTSVVGTTLFITGDNLDNTVRIEGVTAGTVEVQGLSDTKVNGVLGAEVTARNIQNIFMEMGNGNDTAFSVLANIKGLLRFNGGNGNDGLIFGEGNNGQNTFGSLAATMGAGDDTVLVDASETNFSVPGAVVISNGDGINTTYLRATQALQLGPVAVSGGANNDDFQLIGPNVTTGVISVINGNGNNYVGLKGGITINGGIAVVGGKDFDKVEGDFEGNLTVNGSITAALGEGANELDLNHSKTVVTGAITMTGGAGVDRFNAVNGTLDALAITLVLGAANNSATIRNNSTIIRSSLSYNTLGNFDQFSASNLDVRGATVLNTGAESDLIVIDNSRFRGAVSVLAGAGDDSVYIERFNDDGIGTRFDSVVSIDLGAGVDGLEMGLDVDDFVTFASTLIANGGAGTDSVTRSVFNVHAKAPSFLSFP